MKRLRDVLCGVVYTAALLLFAWVFCAGLHALAQ